MEGMVYFILLILYVTLPEEIRASSKISPDTLVRKKRLINNSSSQIAINSIHQVPYIVNMLRDMRAGHCSGTIFSPIDILTAGHCVLTPGIYHVVSNTIFVGQGIIHNVTHIRIHEQYNPHTRKNDLALLKISPAIDFVRSGNRPIPLHIEGNPIVSIPVTSGWGCTGFQPGTHLPVFPRSLQSMALPIINKNLCKRTYPTQAANIDDTVICGRDPQGKKMSCFGDSGNPLVANNHLLGIMSWSAMDPDPRYPDMFIKVYHRTFVQWINHYKHHRD